MVSENNKLRDEFDKMLSKAGWAFDKQVKISCGPINVSGDNLYDKKNEVKVDYILKKGHLQIAVLHCANYFENESEKNYAANRLGLPFTIIKHSDGWEIRDHNAITTEIIENVPVVDYFLKGLKEVKEESILYDLIKGNRNLSTDNLKPFEQGALNSIFWSLFRGKDKIAIELNGSSRYVVAVHCVNSLCNFKVNGSLRILYLAADDHLKEEAYGLISCGDKINLSKEDIDWEVEVEKENNVVYVGTCNDFEDTVLEYLDIDFSPENETNDEYIKFDYIIVDNVVDIKATSNFSTIRDKVDVDCFICFYGYWTKMVQGFFDLPVYIYKQKDAISDGYQVQYFVENRKIESSVELPKARTTQLVTVNDDDEVGDEEGIKIDSNQQVQDELLERELIKLKIDDLVSSMRESHLINQKTLIFCNGFISGDMIVKYIYNKFKLLDHKIEIYPLYDRKTVQSNFKEFFISNSKLPTVGISVDQFSLGPFIPDLRNVVFFNKFRNELLFHNVKSLGGMLCYDSDKRYYVIYDYGNNFESANAPKTESYDRVSSTQALIEGFKDKDDFRKLTANLLEGKHALVPNELRKCLLGLGIKDPKSLFDYYINSKKRIKLRTVFNDFKVNVEMMGKLCSPTENIDDVDVINYLVYDADVINRKMRLNNIWSKTISIYDQILDENLFRINFWRAALEYYENNGIDPLESASTYSLLYFKDQFGSFNNIVSRYSAENSSKVIKADLQKIKALLFQQI